MTNFFTSESEDKDRSRILPGYFPYTLSQEGIAMMEAKACRSVQTPAFSVGWMENVDFPGIPDNLKKIK